MRVFLDTNVLISAFAARGLCADPMRLLRDQTIVPKPSTLLSLKVRDADDAWVLASAVAGQADLLVTGDDDLLVLARKAPLPVVAPREAWTRLRGESAT